MNRDETLKIMSALKAAYPNSYRDLNRGDALSAVNLWHTMLAEVAGQLKSLPKGGEQDGREHDGPVNLG